jgi:hypothetical protein
MIRSTASTSPSSDAALQSVADEVERIVNPPPDNVVTFDRVAIPERRTSPRN